MLWQLGVAWWMNIVQKARNSLGHMPQNRVLRIRPVQCFEPAQRQSDSCIVLPIWSSRKEMNNTLWQKQQRKAILNPKIDCQTILRFLVETYAWFKCRVRQLPCVIWGKVHNILSRRVIVITLIWRFAAFLFLGIEAGYSRRQSCCYFLLH